jgi:hypothetical protein
MKPREDGRWRVLRKRCPDCIVVRGDRQTTRRIRRRGHDDDDDDDDDDDSDDGSETYTASMTHSSALHGEDNSNTTSSYLSGPFQDLGLTLQKTPEAMEVEEATNRLKRRLAARSYHFPGNTWWQDWMQYLSNTHTVLGLFFHHPLHPMRFQERCVILLGSIAIGMTISNFTYMYFIKNGYSMTEVVFTFVVVDITRLMITLWTLGSFVHT